MSPAPGAASTAHDPAGRRRRFEELAAGLYDPLVRYVRRRAPAADVADVVADVLLVVWRRLDDVPPGAELPWCYGVARWCVANRRRSEARRLRLVNRIGAEEAARRLPAGPLDDDPALSEALDALSADDRELVRLWAWEQLEPREIAVVLGLSANAVSLRLTRVKARLAGRLAGRQETDPAGHEAAGIDGHREEAP